MFFALLTDFEIARSVSTSSFAGFMSEFVSFAQMGFALGVGYTALRLIVAPVHLLFVLAMKALFD